MNTFFYSRYLSVIDTHACNYSFEIFSICWKGWLPKRTRIAIERTNWFFLMRKNRYSWKMKWNLVKKKKRARNEEPWRATATIRLSQSHKRGTFLSNCQMLTEEGTNEGAWILNGASSSVVKEYVGWWARYRSEARYRSDGQHFSQKNEPKQMEVEMDNMPETKSFSAVQQPPLPAIHFPFLSVLVFRTCSSQHSPLVGRRRRRGTDIDEMKSRRRAVFFLRSNNGGKKQCRWE